MLGWRWLQWPLTSPWKRRLQVAPSVLRSGAYRVFTRKRVFLVKTSETPSARPFARASICGRTVEELRDRPQELVAYILQGDPQAGTERISSCQERHGANRHDG